MEDSIKDMHPTLQRLFALAIEAKKAATPTELAVLLSESPQTITNWAKRGVSKEGALKAQRLFRWSASWIRDAEGPHRVVPSTQSSDVKLSIFKASNVETAPVLIDSGKVPVVGEVKAGLDGYLEELQYPVGHGDGYIEYWTRDKAAYALRVRNDSMHPRYRAGEFVVVTPSVEASQGHDVVVSCLDGRKLLKQLNRMDADDVQLLSVNGNYEPLTLPRSEILFIHKVGGSVGRDAFNKG